jgi:hypothetical protein
MGFLFSKNIQDKQAVRQEDVAWLVEPPQKGLYFPPQIAERLLRDRSIIRDEERRSWPIDLSPVRFP